MVVLNVDTHFNNIITMTISVGHHSRMLSRMVLVLRFESRGPGGDQESLRLCPQSIRKRPQAFASVAPPWQSKWLRSAELSSLLDSRLVVASQKCQQLQGWGVLDAKRRTVVSFGLALGPRVSNVSTVAGMGGPGRETQNCRHFWTCGWSSHLKNC